MTGDGIARISYRFGIWRLYLPILPVPGSSVRTGKWGSYYLKRYATWIAEADASLAGLEPPVEVTRDPLYVGIFTVSKRPKKITVPLPKGDVDNFAKAVQDAITRSQLIWEDDHQIQVCATGKRYAEEGEEPHTFVMVSRDLKHIEMTVLFSVDAHEVGDDVYDLPGECRVPLVEV